MKKIHYFILILFTLACCAKPEEEITPALPTMECGHCFIITETWKSDQTYVVIANKCEVDTLEYWNIMNINWSVGDTVCELYELDSLK